MSPDSAESAFERGLALSATSPVPAEACEAFREAWRVGGGPPAAFNAGVCDLRRGRLDLAESALRQAVHAAPDHRPGAEALAELLERQGRFAEAVPVREALRGADDVGAELAWASALGSAGDPETAREAVKAVLRRAPDHAEAHVVLARILLVTGDPSADLVIDRALALAPDAGLHNHRALAALRDGDRDTAVRELRAAASVDPGDVAVQLNLGWLALSAGDFERGRAAFEAALRYRPRDADALHGLAVALRGLGYGDEAAHTYDVLLAMGPDQDVVRLNASVLYARTLHDFDTALAVLRPVVSDAATARRQQIESWRDADARLEDPAPPVRRSWVRRLGKALPQWSSTLEEARPCLTEDQAASLELVLAQSEQVIEYDDPGLAQELFEIWGSYAPLIVSCRATR